LALWVAIDEVMIVRTAESRRMIGFLGTARAGWVLSGALLALSSVHCTSSDRSEDAASDARSGCNAGLEACPCRERGELCDRGLACVTGVCVYVAPNTGFGGNSNNAGSLSESDGGSDAGSGGSS
jgi:hypothetical protein